MSAAVIILVFVLTAFTGTFLLSEWLVNRWVLSRRQRREEVTDHTDDHLDQSRDDRNGES